MPSSVIRRRPAKQRPARGCAGLEELQHLGVSVEVHDEGERLQQQPRFQARDVRAVALAHIEHADERERPDRLPQRAARQAQPLGELASFGSRSPGRRSPPRIMDLIFSIASSVSAMTASPSGMPYRRCRRPSPPHCPASTLVGRRIVAVQVAQAARGRRQRFGGR